MKTNLKFATLFVAFLLNFSACSTAGTKDCVSCTKKGFAETEPDKTEALRLKNDLNAPMAMATKGALVIAKEAKRMPAGDTSSKDSYQKGFCSQFEMAQDDVDIETLVEDMNKCPYSNSFKEFWTTPSCHAPLKNDTNVPILFNTASNPIKNESFPSDLHDYLIDEKKDSDTWLRAINTTTSDGYTFLDFLQYNLARGYYSVKSDKDAALRVVSYLCKNGGVYSKYKDSVKCP